MPIRGWRVSAVILAGLAGAAAGHAEDRGCVVAADPRAPSAVRAECRWPVAHQRVAQVLRNQAGIASVLSLVSESRPLSGGRFLQVHAVGWGIADRQITLRFVERTLEDGGLHLDFRPAGTQEPVPPGRVQVEADEGSWQVRPDGRGGTHLRYELRYEAGGGLKPWMARRFQSSGVAKAMAELLAAARRPPGP
ncbi:MAG: hypothetical protein CL910_01290 [Deltaproteobacteria bacterium]|nr:hypothetical protein [Deltaproteobacteria bacterium]